MAAWDLDEVARIEQETFGDPWPRETFADCLELADACWVAQTEEGLEGYGIILIHPGQAHIANLCVRTTARGRGVGRLLLKRLLEAASEQGVEHISLEVRTSNERAIRLYQSAGFEPSGLRSGYYPGGEDALVMVLRCASTRLEEGAE